MKYLPHNDSALSAIRNRQNSERWHGVDTLIIFLLKIHAIQPLYCYAVFEVITAVVMKCPVFWDITPSSPLVVNWRFGGTCRLHLQVRSRGIWHSGFLLSLLFDPEDGGSIFLRNVGWLCNGVHGVISQMIEFFILQISRPLFLVYHYRTIIERWIFVCGQMSIYYRCPLCYTASTGHGCRNLIFRWGFKGLNVTPYGFGAGTICVIELKSTKPERSSNT
jgi:hypothetical protein